MNKSSGFTISVDHYENFPVASIACPPAMRPPIQAIYRFARTADDIADEGLATADQRSQMLSDYRVALYACASGAAPTVWPEVFVPLQRELAVWALPLPLLDALLDAFAQDVAYSAQQRWYADRSELLGYCSRSANPIGRLLLHLYGVQDELALERSDAICTALQLINFWQDLGQDLQRGRYYLPLQDLANHGLSPADIITAHATAATAKLVADECEWAKGLMLQGSALCRQIPGRAGWELRLVVQGGLRILEKIATLNFDTFTQRPKLHKRDMVLLLLRAIPMSWRNGTIAL